MTDTNVQIVLASRPDGRPQPQNFEMTTGERPTPADGEVLLRTLWLSLDPYMRARMAESASASAVDIGSPMVGTTVSQVVESRHPDARPGDIVVGNSGWQSYGVQTGEGLRHLDPADAPITTALGILGGPGFTAWVGLREIGRPQPGETLVVAAATGAVGAVVGQLARRAGARVVGIAGGPHKVAYLSQLGFDAAIDHHSTDFVDELAAATPDGIDVYFENVGGRIFDAVVPRLNQFARVPVCGQMANHDAMTSPAGPNRLAETMKVVLRRSVLIRGFLQGQYAPTLMDEFLAEVAPAVRDGSLVYREDVVEGLEGAAEAFVGLLSGRNFGKLIVRVADPV